MKQGLPEFVIDFKHYFTLPTDEVYIRLQLETKRRCFLLSQYLEHLSDRFFFYQNRVVLDKEHKSE